MGWPGEPSELVLIILQVVFFVGVLAAISIIVWAVFLSSEADESAR